MQSTVAESKETVSIVTQTSDVERRESDPSTTFKEDDFPEGGTRAWLTVVGSFLVYFASFGMINSFGTFQDFYEKDYLSDSPPSAIAFIGSLQITLLYVGGLFTGPLFDAFGLQYMYPLAALGSVISLIALSFTHPQQIWQQFLSQGVLFGLVVGFGTQPALAVVGHYFKRRRALAMGIVAAGSSTGGVCFPIMFTRLFQKIGYAWSVRVGALITLICYGFAMLISRPRLPRRSLTRLSQLVDLDGFKDPRYSVLLAGTFLVNLGLYIPYFYLGPFAQLIGVSSTVHPYLLSMINGASFVGRVLGGQLADRYGRLNVLFPATLIAGVLVLAMWLPAQGAAPLIVFACLYGIMSGVHISVCPAVIGNFSPTDRLGARIGTFFAGIAVATLIGTPLGGAFLRHGVVAEYHNLAIFSGVMIVAGALIIGGARLLCTRNLKAKW